MCLELVTLGLDRALLALYHATGNRDYIVFLEEWMRLSEWRLDIVIGRHGTIAGHAYAYMTRCLAQLELYAVSPAFAGLTRILRGSAGVTRKPNVARTNRNAMIACKSW